PVIGGGWHIGARRRHIDARVALRRGGHDGCRQGSQQNGDRGAPTPHPPPLIVPRGIILTNNIQPLVNMPPPPRTTHGRRTGCRKLLLRGRVARLQQRGAGSARSRHGRHVRFAAKATVADRDANPPLCASNRREQVQQTAGRPPQDNRSGAAEKAYGSRAISARRVAGPATRSTPPPLARAGSAVKHETSIRAL